MVTVVSKRNLTKQPQGLPPPPNTDNPVELGRYLRSVHDALVADRRLIVDLQAQLDAAEKARAALVKRVAILEKNAQS